MREGEMKRGEERKNVGGGREISRHVAFSPPPPLEFHPTNLMPSISYY